MKTIVLAAPGRAQITDATLDALGEQNPGEGWIVARGAGVGGKRDFWEMLVDAAAAWPGEDLLLLEDDIRTARNFIAYARRWPAKHFTSFFNGRRRDTSHQPEPAIWFGFSQAIKVPARLVARLAELGPEPPARGRHQDDALGHVLSGWGELVHYHRSLVQHVGDRSLCSPGDTLEGLRSAVDFVGEDFDCDTL